MTAVPRLQLLPAPGTTPGASAGAVSAQGEQRVKPVVPARTVQRGLPDHRPQPEAERLGDERRVSDRRVSDRRAGQPQIGQDVAQDKAGQRRPAAPSEVATGRLIAFSRLSSMPFMVQVLGQEGQGRAATAPQTSLTGHRDAALLGSDIYRKAGGEPEFLPESATFVRLAV